VLAERDVVAAYHRGMLTKDARLAHIVRREGEVEHDDYLELPQGQVMEGVLVGAARADKTLRDLRLPQAYGCTVVAMSIWDEGFGDWERRPVDADRALRPEDKLIVIGPSEAVARLEADGG
jgi:Trk K+ transport system NAD-binding subunit